ncbi:MAG: tetratricopeptide repeat protein [Myxococcota bacterium]
MSIVCQAARITAFLFVICVSLTGCQETEATDSVLLEQAQRAFAEGRHEQALGVMRELVERNPGDPETQRIYGEALIAAGQPSLAVWPLVQAMKDPDEAIAAGLLLARAQLAGGSGADAIATATKVIEIDPESAPAYMVRARAHLDQKMEEKTIEDLDAAIERGIEDDTVELVRLYALFGIGKVEEAEALLEELHEQAVAEIESNPARAAALCGATATFALENGDAELAENRFDACLADQGLRNRLLVDSAVQFYDGQGKFDRATEIFQDRFEAEETNLAARVAYAGRLRRTGALEESEALLISATEEQPAAWSALVDLYVSGEQFEEALAALDQAIAANPNPPDSWMMSRADFQIILGRLDDAEASLSDVKIDVHRAVIEGRLLLAKGQLPAAANRLEEAVRLWPDNPDVRYLAGNAYERLGDWAKATSHFREAARMKPPHVASSRALAEIQEAVGDFEGRAFVLHRLLEVDPHDADAIEGLLDQWRANGSSELAQQMFMRLSAIPGMQGRALANVARARGRAEGPEAGLSVISKSRADLSLTVFEESLDAKVEFLKTLGRSDEAIDSLSAMIAKEPGRSVFFVKRGAVKRTSDDSEGARSDFEQALALEPDSVDAVLALASIEEGGGHAEAARKLLSRAVSLEEDQADGEALAALALARFELGAGETGAGRARLRSVLDESPRNGAAALSLMDSLLSGEDLENPSRELVDMARRAMFFARSAKARDLSARFASKGRE